MADGGNQRPPNGSGRELVDAFLELTQSLFPPPNDRRSDRRTRDQRSRPSEETKERSQTPKGGNDTQDAKGTKDPKESQASSENKAGSTRDSQERSRETRDDRDRNRRPPSDIPRALRSLFQMFDEQVNPADSSDAEEPIRTLDDLIVSDGLRKQIERALTGVQQHDLLYNKWGIKGIDPRGGCVAVNMFGPPGTGKSLCAEAIAHTLDKPLLRVNYAQLVSKFVGDTPKNIQAVFREAERTDAVLFFDEADSVLGARLTKVEQGVDQEMNVSRSVMLQELESFDGVVLFATNLATQYDPAFRRRMEHIEFKLPGPFTRRRLWEHMLVDKVEGKLPLAESIDFDHLTDCSEGLSGGDIQQVVLRAARRAAMRRGTEQVVMLEDLMQEINHAFRIKEQIGKKREDKTQGVGL